MRDGMLRLSNNTPRIYSLGHGDSELVIADVRGQDASERALRKMSRNIDRVSLPVLVFCREG